MYSKERFIKSMHWIYFKEQVLIFSSRYEVGSENYRIDGKEWYHYFLCGYKVTVVLLYTVCTTIEIATWIKNTEQDTVQYFSTSCWEPRLIWRKLYSRSE